MEGIETILKEYYSLAGKTDAASEARKNEIIAWLEDNAADVRDDAKAFVNAKLEGIESDVAALRSRISDEDYRLLPLSYIVKKYFGNCQIKKPRDLEVLRLSVKINNCLTLKKLSQMKRADA